MNDQSGSTKIGQGGEGEDRPDRDVIEADGGYEIKTTCATQSPNVWEVPRTLTIATLEYRLAVRGRWAIGLTILFALIALGLTTFSGAEVAPDGFERTVASLAALSVYLVPLAALAFGYDSIVGRKESGWLHALFSLPIDRSTVVVGIFTGRAVVLSSAIVIGFGIAGGLLLLEFGLDGWPVYFWFVLAAVGTGCAFLSIAVLVSSIATEKTHALGMVLVIWVWFVLLHDLLSLGVIAALNLSETTVTAMVLSNPASIFRVLTLSFMEIGGGGGFTALYGSIGLSQGALIIIMVGWIVTPLLIAMTLIGRRSL